MRILLIVILGITLHGCNSHNENSKTVSSSKKENVTPIKEQELGDNKWNWNERLAPPEKSEIKEFKYTFELLFKSWTWSYGDKSKPAFTIDKSVFKADSSRFKYTITNDSIRIFTNAEYGDGIDRGIITKLTEDSLVINWSTGDINRYVPIK
jgi:hypothetical protein